MLHLKMVRSPLHHARIVGIDLSDAERVPGLRPRPDRRGRPAQPVHDPRADRRRAGGGVRPRRGPRPVQGRGDRRDPGRDRGGRPGGRRSKVRLDLEELPAVFDVEEALKPGAPIVTHWGNNTFMYEGHPCRRVRLGDVEAGVRPGRPHRRGRLQHEPDRARPARDHRLHRGPRGERPVHRLHEHPGALLQPRQHLDHPPGPGQPAPLRRRHGRRRVRRQGRRHRRADRDPRRDAHRPPGPLRLQPVRGDAGVVDARARGGSTSRTASPPTGASSPARSRATPTRGRTAARRRTR